MIDTVGRDVVDRSWPLLREGGILVSIFDEVTPPTDAVRGEYFVVEPNGPQLAELVRLVDAGALRPVVGRIVPFAEAATVFMPGQPGTTPARRSSSCEGRLTMAVVDDVRALGTELERSYPVYVRGRLKFRVGQLVYVAFSLDETEMGFGFPKDERAALVGGDPVKFRMPSQSDMRFHWVECDLGALEASEAREFVVDAWRMVVPQKVSRAYDAHPPVRPGLSASPAPPAATARRSPC